ncbi:hypothetical protein [Joostella sp. CR20]|uniref:hypothetical protein n=1 Tax=Joostella sp. CR20 TaxID=2804312 RepID=UPI00313D8AC4
MANIERNNTVAYYLDSNELGYQLLKQEPKGWDNDTKSWERDTDSKSIPSKTNISLEFFGDGAAYLNTLSNTWGDVRCRLLKFERDPLDLAEQMKLSFIQELNLKTRKANYKTGGVTIEATEGGLFQDIDSRKDQEYDLKDRFSADGENIGSLLTYKFTPLPRQIDRRSLLEADASDNQFILYSGEWRDTRADAYAGIPMVINYNSHQEDVKAVTRAIPTGDNGHSQNVTVGTPQRTGDQFFLRADRTITINLDLSLKFKITDINQDDADDKLFKIIFITSTYDEASGEIQLKTIENIRIFNSPTAILGKTQTVNWSKQNLVVNEGESLSICYYSYGNYDGGATGGSDNKANYYITAEQADLKIQDQTPFEVTTGKCIKLFDVFNRLAAKITGKQNLVRSSLFGVGGELENVVVDNGFWARNFPDVYEDENGEEKTTQLVTSWEDCFKAAQYWRPLTWFTKLEGNKEVIYVEDAKYTQNNFVGIDLGNVDNVSDEVSGDNFFKSLEFGMEGDIEYEEVNGLDEYNGKSKFTTYRDRAEQIYTATTPYRVDAMGYEITRRKQYSDYPTEDTDRDEDIWMHDAKVEGNGYTHRDWRDDFSQAPKGIFNPDSAWNLRLSPANRMMYGHSYAFNCALFHFQNKKVRFNSSNANSNLITYTNGKELKENGEYSVKDFELPLVVPKLLNLEFRLTKKILNQIEGVTRIEFNNTFIEVPNVFGRVKFTYKGEEYYGRLIKLDTDEQSKMQLIEVHV